MAYYTLLTRHEGVWHPQFGDHDRETVEQERRDILNSSDEAEWIEACNTQIIKTKTAHQYLIDREVKRLNEGSK